MPASQLEPLQHPLQFAGLHSAAASGGEHAANAKAATSRMTYPGVFMPVSGRSRRLF